MAKNTTQKKLDMRCIRKAFESIRNIAGETLEELENTDPTQTEEAYITQRGLDLVKDRCGTIRKEIREKLRWQTAVRRLLPPAAGAFVMSIPAWFMTPALALGYLGLVGIVGIAGVLTDRLVRRLLRRQF